MTSQSTFINFCKNCEINNFTDGIKTFLPLQIKNSQINKEIVLVALGSSMKQYNQLLNQYKSRYENVDSNLIKDMFEEFGISLENEENLVHYQTFKKHILNNANNAENINLPYLYFSTLSNNNINRDNNTVSYDWGFDIHHDDISYELGEFINALNFDIDVNNINEQLKNINDNNDISVVTENKTKNNNFKKTNNNNNNEMENVQTTVSNAVRRKLKNSEGIKKLKNQYGLNRNTKPIVLLKQHFLLIGCKNNKKLDHHLKKVMGPHQSLNVIKKLPPMDLSHDEWKMLMDMVYQLNLSSMKRNDLLLNMKMLLKKHIPPQYHHKLNLQNLLAKYLTLYVSKDWPSYWSHSWKLTPSMKKDLVIYKKQNEQVPNTMIQSFISL